MKTFAFLFSFVLAAAVFAGSAPAAPTEAAATTGVTPLTRDLLLASLSRAVTAHFNLEGDLSLELTRSWVPPSQVAHAWRVDVIEYPAVATSAMMLRCRITADGALVAEPTMVVRAALWRDVWATRFPLTTGAGFDPAILEVRRVDMFRERDAVPTAVGDRTHIFARSIPGGRLLTWNDISTKPLVKKGAMVEVTASEGMLSVSMKGLAMENGGRGDKVTIRNPDSRKDFVAMVVDENRVQVRF